MALHNAKWKHGTQPPLQSGHGGTVSLEVTVILITCDKSSTSTRHHSASAVPTECFCHGNSPSPSSASSLCRERPITATKNSLCPGYPISGRHCSSAHTQPAPQLTLPVRQAPAIATRAAFLLLQGTFLYGRHTFLVSHLVPLSKLPS